MVGREVPAQVTPGQAGSSGAGGGSTHTGFCAVLGKPIRLFALTFASKRKMQAPYALPESQLLWAGLAASSLSFRSSTVHDYGQLGCRFFFFFLNPSVT